jgi:hypothetical protein
MFCNTTFIFQQCFHHNLYIPLTLHLPVHAPEATVRASQGAVYAPMATMCTPDAACAPLTQPSTPLMQP